MARPTLGAETTFSGRFSHFGIGYLMGNSELLSLSKDVLDNRPMQFGWSVPHSFTPMQNRPL